MNTQHTYNKDFEIVNSEIIILKSEAKKARRKGLNEAFIQEELEELMALKRSIHLAFNLYLDKILPY